MTKNGENKKKKHSCNYGCCRSYCSKKENKDGTTSSSDKFGYCKNGFCKNGCCKCDCCKCGCCKCGCCPCCQCCPCYACDCCEGCNGCSDSSECVCEDCGGEGEGCGYGCGGCGCSGFGGCGYGGSGSGGCGGSGSGGCGGSGSGGCGGSGSGKTGSDGSEVRTFRMTNVGSNTLVNMRMRKNPHGGGELNFDVVKNDDMCSAKKAHRSTDSFQKFFQAISLCCRENLKDFCKKDENSSEENVEKKESSRQKPSEKSKTKSRRRKARAKSSRGRGRRAKKGANNNRNADFNGKNTLKMVAKSDAERKRSVKKSRIPLISRLFSSKKIEKTSEKIKVWTNPKGAKRLKSRKKTKKYGDEKLNDRQYENRIKRKTKSFKTHNNFNQNEGKNYSIIRHPFSNCTKNRRKSRYSSRKIFYDEAEKSRHRQERRADKKGIKTNIFYKLFNKSKNRPKEFDRKKNIVKEKKRRLFEDNCKVKIVKKKQM